MNITLSLLKQRVNSAFRSLKKHGYFAEQNFKCCLGCATNAIPVNCKSKFVFYHEQDGDNMEDTGCLYLAWCGDSTEIIKILKDNGLCVKWSGLINERMIVSYDTGDA
jgi:hypothetical protein